MPGRDLDEMAYKINQLKESTEFWRGVVGWIEEQPTKIPKEYLPGYSISRSPSSKPSPKDKPMATTFLQEARAELDELVGKAEQPEPYKCPYIEYYSHRKSTPHICVDPSDLEFRVIYDNDQQRRWKKQLPWYYRLWLWGYTQRKLTWPKTLRQLRFSIKWGKRALAYEAKKRAKVDAMLKAIQYEL